MDRTRAEEYEATETPPFICVAQSGDGGGLAQGYARPPTTTFVLKRQTRARAREGTCRDYPSRVLAYLGKVS